MIIFYTRTFWKHVVEADNNNIIERNFIDNSCSMEVDERVGIQQCLALVLFVIFFCKILRDAVTVKTINAFEENNSATWLSFPVIFDTCERWRALRGQSSRDFFLFCFIILFFLWDRILRPGVCHCANEWTVMTS